MIKVQTENHSQAQSARAGEYSECTSTEGKPPKPNECPVYNIYHSIS